MPKSKDKLWVNGERDSLVERINARYEFNSEHGILDEDDNELQHWLADLNLLDRKLENLREMADLESGMRETRETCYDDYGKRDGRRDGRNGRTARAQREAYSGTGENY